METSEDANAYPSPQRYQMILTRRLPTWEIPDFQETGGDWRGKISNRMIRAEN